MLVSKMKRALAAWVLLLFAGTSLFAQEGYQDAFTKKDPVISKFANTITANDLEAHIRFLASDELEGRETAERGQKLAAKYLATQFKKIGLKPGNIAGKEPSYMQSFELVKTEVRSASLYLESKKKKEYKLFDDFIAFSDHELASSVNLPMAFAGYGIETDGYNNLKGKDFTGKAAVVLFGEPLLENGKSAITDSYEYSPWATDLILKREALGKRGAELVVMVVDNDRYKQFSGNKYLRMQLARPRLRLKHLMTEDLPGLIVVSESTANGFLKKAKTSMSKLEAQMGTQPTVPDVNLSKSRFVMDADATMKTVTAENILGFLEGTDKKEEVVVITAHYDHLGVKGEDVYNGADDDGSGTASLLELAEAFMMAAKSGHRPRRSILFMPVSGEEKGLLGSRYYTDFPVYPLEQTVVDLNIDMIGRVDEHHSDPNYVYIIGSDKLSTDLHLINEKNNSFYSKLNLDYKYNDPKDPNRFYYRSDHYNFAKNNIPVIFYFTGVHEDYHKPTDTWEKIDEDKMVNIVKLVFAVAWETANRPEKLKVDVKNEFPADR